MQVSCQIRIASNAHKASWVFRKYNFIAYITTHEALGTLLTTVTVTTNLQSTVETAEAHRPSAQW